jgi:hypothetical protein
VETAITVAALVDDVLYNKLGFSVTLTGLDFILYYRNLRNGHEWSEDYQGPSSSGFFKWMPDENGQMRPVTRMKEKNLERSPQFWDRVYSDKKGE